MDSDGSSRPSLHHGPRLTRLGDTASLDRRALPLAWAAFVVLSAVDCLTTVYALRHQLTEVNPIAAAVYAGGGAVALWAFKFGVLALIMPLLMRLPRRIGLLVALLLVAVMWTNDVSNVTWIVRG
ncbi:MAG TPA: DUF5658 family protein [Candidatus Binatia bacterium]|nr:DUF5658 family protein [Candidatus Binatia bacterium]